MRLIALDVLRAVAIFLVLGRHAEWDNVWHTGGWVGVDLFFVLSGFLVSGLLFAEYQKQGSINPWRFLIRRGFKIYPAFWLLIATTWLIGDAIGQPVSRGGILHELFFLQGYTLDRLWVHTWSLAVEEHFYIALPAVLLLASRDGFKKLPRLVAAIAVVSLACRLVLAWHQPYHCQTHLFPTHLRLDSLFFGVLISYYYHVHRDWLLSFDRRALFALGVLLMAPAFIWQLEATPFLYTVGLTTNYLGSGAILIASLSGMPENRVTRGLAGIGRHSYSIYLWHALVLWFVPNIALYMVMSIVVGVVLSQLVEQPCIRLRDYLYRARLLPSRDVGSSIAMSES